MRSALASIDAALIDMRRLWAPTTSGRTPQGADTGIDLSTVLVVTALGGKDQGLSVTEIAEALGIAPATASRICDRAVAGGYVTKSPSTTDARRLSLELTPVGLTLRERAEEFRLDYLAGILDTWDPADVEAFERLLARFATAVHAHPPTITGSTP